MHRCSQMVKTLWILTRAGVDKCGSVDCLCLYWLPKHGMVNLIYTGGRHPVLLDVDPNHKRTYWHLH